MPARELDMREEACRRAEARFWVRVEGLNLKFDSSGSSLN